MSAMSISGMPMRSEASPLGDPSTKTVTTVAPTALVWPLVRSHRGRSDWIAMYRLVSLVATRSSYVRTFPTPRPSPEPVEAQATKRVATTSAIGNLTLFIGPSPTKKCSRNVLA